MDVCVYLYCYKFLQMWIVLLVVIPNLSGRTWAGSSANPYNYNSLRAPEFDDMPLKEVDAVVGQTLLLPCTVRNLADRVVSWIRTKDLHILTSGSLTFSADSRFESVYSTNRDFWGLRLRGARIADTGQYECQVNTDPKMSFAINLTVTESAASPSVNYLGKISIKGPKEVIAPEGTPVVFTCEVYLLAPPTEQLSVHDIFIGKARVRWFQDKQELSFEKGGGGISVVTDYTDRKVISRLKVAMVTFGNAGTYTCTYASIKPDSVRLSVLESEHTEAMQRDYPQQYSRGTRGCALPHLVSLQALHVIFKLFL